LLIGSHSPFFFGVVLLAFETVDKPFSGSVARCRSDRATAVFGCYAARRPSSTLLALVTAPRLQLHLRRTFRLASYHAGTEALHDHSISSLRADNRGSSAAYAQQATTPPRTAILRWRPCRPAPTPEADRPQRQEPADQTVGEIESSTSTRWQGSTASSWGRRFWGYGRAPCSRGREDLRISDNARRS